MKTEIDLENAIRALKYPSELFWIYAMFEKFHNV